MALHAVSALPPHAGLLNASPLKHTMSVSMARTSLSSSRSTLGALLHHGPPKLEQIPVNWTSAARFLDCSMTCQR